MKRAGFRWTAVSLAAAALCASIGVLCAELWNFRESVGVWAERDLAARTQMAAETAERAMATDDFRRLREFGDSCRADGVRLTVLGIPGGLVYDSDSAAAGDHSDRPEIAAALSGGTGSSIRVSSTTGEECLYCAKKAGGFTVRLAVPSRRVYAPFRRAGAGLVLAGLVGATGLLLITLFTGRLLAGIRERERMLEEMRRAEAFRRDFVADLAHELKTPLTSLMGAAELLAADGGGMSVEDRASLLSVVGAESRRLDALAKDILSLSRLEHDPGGMRRTFAAARLDEIVRSVRERFAAAPSSAGVSIETEDPLAEISAVCDARLVEQALSNLVSNAVRHSGSDRVVLSLSLRDGAAVAGVRDFGAGLSPEDAARVFDRFFRADRSRSRESGGTGLGLAIVKHIALLHGGSVRVETEPERGCLFEIILPAGKAGGKEE